VGPNLILDPHLDVVRVLISRSFDTDSTDFSVSLYIFRLCICMCSKCVSIHVKVTTDFSGSLHIFRLRTCMCKCVSIHVEVHTDFSMSLYILRLRTCMCIK
jgi:hypothetical protein